MANNKPIETIRDGSLKATIWERQGEKGPFYSVEITRSYRDQNGAWHDSNSFIGDELLRIARLATIAYDETLILRNRDQSKSSTSTPRSTPS